MVTTVAYCVVDWDGKVINTQTVVKGKDAVIPQNPVREGYTFTGWHKDPGCTEPYSFADGVSGSFSRKGSSPNM